MNKEEIKVEVMKIFDEEIKKIDLVFIANELHRWIERNKDDEILSQKIKIISENLDDVINSYKLYK